MASQGDVVVELAGSASRDPMGDVFDLFVVHAAADADFVRGYLLPALDLPPPRVLLVDELTPDAALVSEIERGVSQSRVAVAVLSPAYLEHRWAVFGEQLASYLSVEGVQVVPLRWTDGALVLRLEGGVGFAFTQQARWAAAAARVRQLLRTANEVPQSDPDVGELGADELVARTEAAQRTQRETVRDLGYGAEVPVLALASEGEIEDVERHAQEARHLLGMTYLERGRALLLDGHALQALPYFVAARSEAIESPELRMLFAQALRSLPLVTFAGHGAPVRAASFSPDGTRVVTASADHTARVWDASAGTPVITPLCHEGEVRAAAWSPDGTRVVTATGLGMAWIWDAATGKPLTPPLEHHRSVHAAAFSPDGRCVVTASGDHTARLWDASTGQLVTLPLEHQRTVYAAAFSPDGRWVVTASGDHTARVWHAATGRAVTAPLRHRCCVSAAAFSPDGKWVVTASWDHTARIWDASTGQPLLLTLPHGGLVHAAAFSPDGTRVVTASDDRTARIWDATTGQALTPPLKHRGEIHVAAWSPDGMRVVTASWDHTARIWDATTGRAVAPSLEHPGSVSAAAFSPDGTRVVTASDDKTARVWDTSTGKLVTGPLEHQGPVHAAAFCPDGMRVVTASRDHTARIWTLPIHMGSLEDWRLLARCSPFVLVNGVLTSNPDPPRKYPRH